MNMQTARGRAIAAQDHSIAANVAKIEEAKARPSALDALASKLNVSPGALTTTLKNTVFKGASNDEFVALVIVSNAYGLNPLLKEIFAFPAKGGGIIPVVSVDGWIRIINEHPQFDGIEFNDIVDENGNLYAIESVIYRRDRTRPIKVTEYMDECKGAGPAWQKTPKRMLRHRALIQGGRVAFGFSGIYVEDEASTFAATVQQDGGNDARNITYPSRQQTMVAHDVETGEIIEDEETARALDAQTDGWQEGPTDEQRGERTDLATAKSEIDSAETVIDVNSRVAALVDLLGDEDADTLREYAMDRIDLLKERR
ncbi:recombinase RecT [Sphingobium arseniciresistens]|uniref:recombinase RecT n=1 Tax=Sphingobium arseniciresistens TaxID=3030834 RepID=UPI003BAEEE12